jgi:hypothetical protein
VKITNNEAPHFEIFSTLLLPSPLTLLDTNIFSTFSSKTFNPCSSLQVRDEISQPYKTMFFLHTLILTVLDTR